MWQSLADCTSEEVHVTYIHVHVWQSLADYTSGEVCWSGRGGSRESCGAGLTALRGTVRQCPQ